MPRNLQELEEKIGYKFKNIDYLQTAITHSSFLNEKAGKGEKCYERLEFLGDSVLGMLTADMLFHAFEKMPEGELTRRRAMLVCEASLASAAISLEIGDFMRLGRGEDGSGGRGRVSILADMLEAVIAAIYLDGGIEAVRHFTIVKVFSALSEVEITDYKSALQEKVQAANSGTIAYQLIGESGPDHDKRFTVEVLVGEKAMGQGIGVSKKEAEQAAAREALKII
jgi:ribonuclease-3